MLPELAGCERLTQRMADALAQAQQAEQEAKEISEQFSRLAHIVDQLTGQWMEMTNERKAELLADYLTDAERRRIFTPEYQERKRAEQEQAEQERKQAQERDEARRRWQAEQAAAERAPYERIDALSKVELFAEAFEGAGPADIRQMLLSGDRRLRYMLAPQFSNAQGVISDN